MAENKSTGTTYSLGENASFSGADMRAYIIFPECTPISIGEVSTMTYSTYRETHPVRTIGRINPKGFSRGPRTIAGTIIFTVFQKHIVNRIKEEVPYLKNIRKLKPGELPPFDIMISMGNEYGESARIFIYGIEVVDEGKVFSIEDLFTENTWSYMARDIDLMDDIMAEQNAPIIILGDKDQSGIYDKNDLVLDKDLVEMNKQMQAMLDEKKAAIEEVRNQNKDYVQGLGQVATEKIEYPDTGANDTGWIPPDDFIGDLDKCGEFTVKQTNSWEQGSGNNRSFCFKLDIVGNGWLDKNVYESKEYIYADDKDFKKHSTNFGVELKVECNHGGNITKTITPKAGDIGVRTMYARVEDTVHAQRPRFYVRPSAKAVKYDKSTYKVDNPDWKEVAMDSMGTINSPIKYIWTKENSKADNKAENAKSLTVELNAVPTSRNAIGKYKSDNVQIVYKDVGVIPPREKPYVPYQRADKKWICPMGEYSWAVPEAYYSYPKLQKGLSAGFNITATFKKNGTNYTLTKDEKKNTVLTCTSAIEATILDPDTGTKKNYTLEGSAKVGKVKIHKELFDGLIREQLKWKWNDLTSGKDSNVLKLKATGSDLGWAGGILEPHLCYADLFYRDVHYSLDSPNATVSTPSVLATECKCGFLHQDMELVLKNFKIQVNGVDVKTTFKVSGVSNTCLRFPVDILDNNVRKALEVGN